MASSAVTMPAVSRAAAMTASTSSGLTVGIESTRAEMPSSASCSAATSARQSTVPLLIRVTSPPVAEGDRLARHELVVVGVDLRARPSG